MVIDTHCHLNDERFKDSYSQIIQDMEKDNLSKLIVASYDFPSTKKALEIASQFENVYCLLGMHPHDSKLYSQEMEDYIVKNASNEKVLGIGEIGLDYFYDLSDRETQKQVFCKQIVLADKLGLPIVIHTRDAWEDTLKILNDYKSYINNGLLLHCFTGSVEVMKELNKLGAYFAFGGTITFKNANKIFDVIKAVPKDKILVETDSPYLTPVPFRGQTNTPKMVNLVVEKLAEVLQMDRTLLEELLNQNTKNLFKKLR